MDELLKPVDAGQEKVVDSQNNTISDVVVNEAKTSLENADQTTTNTQSAEENAKYAQARREAEIEAKIVKERAEKTIQLIKKVGSSFDVYSDEEVAKKFGQEFGVYTLEELDKEVERQESIKKTGVDPKKIDEIVEARIKNHPALQEIERKKQDSIVNENLQSLNETFGTNYSRVEDLQNMPNYAEFYNYVVNNKLDFVRAYKLASNEEPINNKQINQASKGHIKATAQNVTGGVSDVINPEIWKEIQKFRQHFPKKTDAELVALYKKTNGGR